MAGLFNIIELTEFESIYSLQIIINHCITLRDDYWYDITNREQCILLVQFSSKEEQVNVLRDITNDINNGILPSNDILDKIPKRYLGGEEILLDFNRARWCPIELRNDIALIKRDSNIKLLVLYSALNSKERSHLYTTITFDLTCSIEEILEIEELKNFAMSYWNLKTTLKGLDIFSASLKLFNARLCPECDKQNSNLKCPVCRVTYYCSKEHQTVNWNDHKHLCLNLRILKFASGRELIKLRK